MEAGQPALKTPLEGRCMHECLRLYLISAYVQTHASVLWRIPAPPNGGITPPVLGGFIPSFGGVITPPPPTSDDPPPLIH